MYPRLDNTHWRHYYHAVGIFELTNAPMQVETR